MGWFQIILFLLRYGPTLVKLVRELKELFDGDAKACSAAIKAVPKDKLKSAKSVDELVKAMPREVRPKKWSKSASSPKK